MGIVPNLSKARLRRAVGIFWGLPSADDGNHFVLTASVMLYSRRTAMTNTLFDETCLERAMEELEDQQKRPQP